MPLRSFALLLLLLLAAVSFAQTTAPGSQPPLRIIAPRAGEKISANFVTVRFELLNPAASADSSPNYQVRLDGRDPVRTTDVEFTFSGLTAGQHSVMVELVDANGTPIAGTRAQVRFHVAQQQPMPADTVPDHSDIVRQTSNPALRFSGSRLVPAVMTWVERDASPQDAQSSGAQPQAATAGRRLPHSSSALPLLSVIGLGALLGGLASAMRTR